MLKNEYEPGWFYGYAPTEQLDDNGKTIFVDSKNVVGRFVDSNVINVQKSEENGKSTYDICTILETRLLRNALDGASTDVAAQIIRFDNAYRIFSVDATKRFPEAWEAYCKKRKSPVSEDERRALGVKAQVRKGTKK